MSLTEKRVTLGIIPGGTREERLSNAARLARSINADMLVYGVLTSGPDPELALEFYVAPLRNQADEILGTYALGAPIAVSLPIRYSDTREDVEDVLLDRSGIVTNFVRGLNKDKSRRPAEALPFFEQALSDQYWSGSDKRGQEVIHLFIGRQHYALAEDYDKSGDRAKALEEYQKAYEAFRRAKAINPSYARAYIGEGNVYYQLSSHAAPVDRVTTPCIDLTNLSSTVELPCMEIAIKEYIQAVDFAERLGGSGAYADIRAHMALGGAYRTYAESYMHRGDAHAAEFDKALPLFDKALSLFDMAIEEQTKVLALLEGKSLPNYVVLANLNLGAAYHEKGVVKERLNDRDEARILYEKARAAYTGCVESASERPGDRELQPLATQCQFLQGKIDEALANLGKQP